MSPIFVVAIYFLAWRQCRRMGQAIAETAAWIVGYLATYVLLVVLHFGHPGLVSLSPESFSFVFAVIGGFITMKLSHWLWRRRGGHLEPAKHPFAAKHWVRAARAMLLGGKPRPPRPGSAAAAPRAATTTTTSTRQPARPRQTNRWVRVARAMLDTESSRGRTRR